MLGRQREGWMKFYLARKRLLLECSNFLFSLVLKIYRIRRPPLSTIRCHYFGLTAAAELEDPCRGVGGRFVARAVGLGVGGGSVKVSYE